MLSSRWFCASFSRWLHLCPWYTQLPWRCWRPRFIYAVRSLSRALNLYGQRVYTILLGCPQTISNLLCPKLNLSSCPSHKLLFLLISHSGVNVNIANQKHGVSASLPLALSVTKSVPFCLLNSFFFFAWITAVAPQWSPSFQSLLISPLPYSCWSDHFPASNGFPLPTKSSSNSSAWLPKPFMNWPR